MELNLSPEIERQITMLVKQRPIAAYSPGVEKLLMDAGFISELQVAELTGDQMTTLQSRRSRGHMPPHFKFGSLVCYRSADIAAAIANGQVYRRGKPPVALPEYLLKGGGK